MWLTGARKPFSRPILYWPFGANEMEAETSTKLSLVSEYKKLEVQQYEVYIKYIIYSIIYIYNQLVARMPNPARRTIQSGL